MKTKKENIIKLFGIGYTPKEISEKTNSSNSYIYQVIRENKLRGDKKELIKLMKNQGQENEVEDKEIIKVVSSGELDDLLNWVSPANVIFEEGYGSTEDRGPRTDHCGDQGEDWATEEELAIMSAPFEKKWNPIIEKLLGTLKLNKIKAEGYLEYGEKGHISLVFNQIK